MSDLDFADSETPVRTVVPVREERPAALAPYLPPAEVKITGRTAPHSLEAEESLLSCCLLEDGDLVARCVRAKIGPQSFYLAAHGIVFERLLSLKKRGIPVDVAVLAEDLKAERLLPAVGGFPFIAQISKRQPTTAQASFFIEKVRELYLLREMIRTATGAVEECYAFSGDIAGFTTAIQEKVGAVARLAHGEIVAKAVPITTFRYPTGGDPNILLGDDDYLGRGGGMLFVSHAGAGKSSFIADAVMSWGLGRPWMGIKSNGKLKTLIIQAEDSERYMGKIFESYAHIMELTPSELDTLTENVVVAKVKGVSGAAFFAELERLVGLHSPDIVVINPIYLYAEGDIGESKCAQPFLVGLDHINRAEKFAYILVHHTGKPAKNLGAKKVELDDWETIYMGFGSSYLANWPRCSALLEPRPKESTRFLLKLGKGGKNAGVMKEIPQGTGFRLEPTTRIALRFSSDKILIGDEERKAILWVADENDEAATGEDESRDATPSSKAGRGSKFSFAEFRTAFEKVAPSEEKRQGFNVLFKAATAVKHISRGTMNTIIDKGTESGVLIKHHEDGRYFIASTK